MLSHCIYSSIFLKSGSTGLLGPLWPMNFYLFLSKSPGSGRPLIQEGIKKATGFLLLYTPHPSPVWLLQIGVLGWTQGPTCQLGPTGPCEHCYSNWLWHSWASTVLQLIAVLQTSEEILQMAAPAVVWLLQPSRRQPCR